MPKDTWWNLPADKRERVTRAAMAEFGARGFSVGSLNVVAREAGISKGSLFQYFEDKLDLFRWVCVEAASRAVDATLEGVDPDGDQPFFKSMRRVVLNLMRFFRSHPLERGIAHAAQNEIDPDAWAAVRSVSNAHFVEAFRPLVKRAADRGELRRGVNRDELVAMMILLLRHLNVAPFYPHVDPVLGLYEKTPAEAERSALSLIGALERAYGRPRV